jgi:hypothetical protein
VFQPKWEKIAAVWSAPALDQLTCRSIDAERFSDVVGMPQRQYRDGRCVRWRFRDNPADGAIAAGDDEQIGRLAKRRRKVGLWGVVIGDQVAGSGDHCDELVVTVRAVAGGLVVYQRYLSGHFHHL